MKSSPQSRWKHIHHPQNFLVPLYSPFLQPPSQTQANTDLLTVPIDYFVLSKLYINGIIQHVPFFLAWLLSLSIHAIVCLSSSFPFIAGQYCIVCMCRNLGIYSSFDEHSPSPPPGFNYNKESCYEHSCTVVCVDIYFFFSQIVTQERNDWLIWQIYI